MAHIGINCFPMNLCLTIKSENPIKADKYKQIKLGFTEKYSGIPSVL